MDHQLRCDWADDVLGQCEDERGHVGPHMVTGRENPSVRFFREQPQTYAEGYKAGRIAALREVGCESQRVYGSRPCPEQWWIDPARREHNAAAPPPIPLPREHWCIVCRLLAEAESGKDAAEVGDDR